MADPRERGFAKDNSLDDLNKFLREQEDQRGPLVGIGNDGTQTILTFDMDLAPPEKHAIIQKGNPPVSDSGIKGKVFIDGQLKDAFATRPD
jgi:hypothetical protein